MSELALLACAFFLVWLFIDVVAGRRPGRAGRRSGPRLGWRWGRAQRAERAREEKGREGEALVAAAIAGLGLPALHDVYVPLGNGEFTQIDHLVHLGNRLAVVETKNWDGTFEGGLDGEHWRRDGVAFSNPVRQNAHHLSMLKRIVGRTWLDSVVVMVGTARPPLGTESVVTDLDGLEGRLRPGAAHPAVEAMWERLLDLNRGQDKARIGAAHKRRLQDKRAGRAW